jgi:hypothetical protein
MHVCVWMIYMMCISSDIRCECFTCMKRAERYACTGKSGKGTVLPVLDHMVKNTFDSEMPVTGR